MLAHIRANVWLTVLSIGLSAVIYPLIVLAFGQTLFPNASNGSLLYDKSGKLIGSSLIAQPFSGDEYFHPRPSAVGYNAAATAGSNWAANNYLLRDRVARMLGPIVKYASGEKKGQLVGPDIEAWFQQDQYQGAPGIVGQWAALHPSVVSNWVKADPLNADYVTKWKESHADEIAQWLKDNPDNIEPKPEDLAAVFFTDYSKANSGTFPAIVETKNEVGKSEKVVQSVKEGSDIQSIFFDMWRQDQPTADLQKVPADMVTTSGAGLDPDITWKSAMYQLDRVVAKRAADANLPEADVRKTIEDLLKAKATAPLGGLAGVSLVNVLEINLALDERYPKAPERK